MTRPEHVVYTVGGHQFLTATEAMAYRQGNPRRMGQRIEQVRGPNGIVERQRPRGVEDAVREAGQLRQQYLNSQRIQHDYQRQMSQQEEARARRELIYRQRQEEARGRIEVPSATNISQFMDMVNREFPSLDDDDDDE